MRKYEIYDRKSCNLLAEGTFKEVNGQYVIQCLLPDSDDIEVFIDGKKVQTVPRIKPEVVEDDQIKEIYWTYGKKYTRLCNKSGDGDDVVWQSKYYYDLNLHIVVETGNDGKIVWFVLEREDGREIILRKIVSGNHVVFDKVFEK